MLEKVRGPADLQHLSQQQLTDLAAEVGLHRATAYRILLDLVRRGWVLRAGDRYLPGAAVLRMSASAAGNSLTALARPVLERLSAATSMMVNLQVLEEGGARRADEEARAGRAWA